MTPCTNSTSGKEEKNMVDYQYDEDCGGGDAEKNPCLISNDLSTCDDKPQGSIDQVGDVDFDYGYEPDYGYGDPFPQSKHSSSNDNTEDSDDDDDDDDQRKPYGANAYGFTSRSSIPPGQQDEDEGEKFVARRRNSCLVRKEQNPLAVAEFLMGGPPLVSDKELARQEQGAVDWPEQFSTMTI